MAESAIHNRRFRSHVWAAAIVVFLIALVPRLFALSETTIYVDEIRWHTRSALTLDNLRDLDFSHGNLYIPCKIQRNDIRDHNQCIIQRKGL